MRAILDIAGTGDPADTLLAMVAERAGVDRSRILHAELFLCDAQPATRSSLSGRLFSASGIDNKAGCYSLAEAIIGNSIGHTIGSSTAMAVFYDHEEIGSRTHSGADSVILSQLLERIVEGCEEGADARGRALARSSIVSIDAAHAKHPSYRDKHDSGYAPVPGGGPVLKSDVNQRYAASPQLAAMFRRLCLDGGFGMQELISRADMRPGSTVGPISAAHTGIATIDTGIAILAMHSIRETAALEDVDAMTRFTTGYFEQ